MFHNALAAGVSIGYGLGNYVECDLDMIQKTRSENEVIEKNKLFGCAWFGYWAFYG